MRYPKLWLIALCVAVSTPAVAQLSQDARIEILRTMTAEQAAARIAMPLGGDGVQLSDTGQIDEGQLAKEIRKNGSAIPAGKIVTITNIDFGDRTIELELDGGGKSKKGFFDRVQIGIGPATTAPDGTDDSKKAKGSKVTLKFAQKISSGLTPDELKKLFSLVLDFEQSNFLRSGIESLPPEFQEAVKLHEARIGMDRSTVILAMGRPINRFRETKGGVEIEDWEYAGRGLRRTFVTFDLKQNVVISVREYSP